MKQEDLSYAMASQEEHIKRSMSCERRPSMSHRWVERTHKIHEGWVECGLCGVTQTTEDYDKKMAATTS